MTGDAPRAFRRVLAVCGPDDAEDAPTLELAGSVADRHGASLDVLAVQPSPTRYLRVRHDADASRLERETVDARRARLDRLVDEVRPGRSVGAAVRLGKPFLETVRHVLQGGHDLVIKTAEELDGLGHHLLASADHHLLRKCPATVWLRRPGRGDRPSKVLAAVDVDPDGAEEPETEDALNQRILAEAAAIATHAVAELHAITVWDAPAETLVRSWSSYAEGAEDYAAALESAHWTGLDRTIQAAGLDPRTVRRHVVRGSARTAIPQAVRDLDCDLLVLGTIARTGVPGLLIGNTAEDVLNSVQVPLVAVKPPGYVSPIRLDS
jgi:nucleotide-binding universal stress UspA family protein